MINGIIGGSPRLKNEMRASVFIGTSVDGFIARPNGDLDFLPAGGGEPHGYAEFIESVDALIIGRNTYETVLGFDTWPYGEKPVFVLSIDRWDAIIDRKTNSSVTCSYRVELHRIFRSKWR